VKYDSPFRLVASTDRQDTGFAVETGWNAHRYGEV